ncbi:MAG: glycosyltransferase family 4 protein, partial [Candidatus Omnitrophota bacterium]
MHKEKMKRAVFLTIDFPPMGGGMARHAADVCRSLRRIGFESLVIAPSSAKTTSGIDEEFVVRRLKKVRAGKIFDNYMLSVAAYFFSGLRSYFTRKSDLIIANTWSVAGVAAFLIRKLTGAPYIVFAHGLDVYAPQTGPAGNNRVRHLMEAVLENASVVITNSNFTKGLIEEGAKKAKVVVLNPMVDPARLVVAVSPGGDGEPGKKKVILSVGRLVESKGHDLVMRSLPAVLARFPDTIYNIVGCGPHEKVLRALAISLGVSGHIVFTGEIDESALIGHYRGCDVFVLTSRQIPERGEVE